jgi:tetratricopeptide (TPR) repeat protein
LARYRQEIDNVRAALDWSFSPAGDPAIGVVLAAEYVWVWVNLSLFFECGKRARQALDHIAAGSELSVPLRPQLLFALAIALTNMMGPVQKTKDVLVAALQTAESHDDPGLHLWILWALWALQLNVGECREAQSTAERYAQVALRTGDPATILPGHRLIGTALQFGGDQHEALRAFARALEPPFSGQDLQHPAWPRQHRAMTLAALARTLWLQGSVIQARDMARESFDLACAEPPVTTRFEILRAAVCPVAFMSGDLAAAEQAVTAMAELAASTNAVFWKVVSDFFEGALLIRRGEFGRGLTVLSAVLDTYEKAGWKPGYLQYQAVFAKGVAGLGRYAEAVAMVDGALAAADHGRARWYVAEFLRIKGEFLLQESGDNAIPAAEGPFREALELARKQGALSWELRTAISFARLKVRQGRRTEAREILAPVYQQFTEGFETADLRSAKAILEAL